MAELLMKFVDAVNPDPTIDAAGCYKAGMVVEIRPDGCIYGTSECYPTFVIIKVPLIAVDNPTLLKLCQIQQTQTGTDAFGQPIYTTVKRRQCWFQLANIPAGALNLLKTNGSITIKATAAYTGTYDYTWLQVKNYFWNNLTQLNDFPSSI